MSNIHQVSLYVFKCVFWVSVVVKQAPNYYPDEILFLETDAKWWRSREHALIQISIQALSLKKIFSPERLFLQQKIQTEILFSRKNRVTKPKNSTRINK